MAWIWFMYSHEVACYAKPTAKRYTCLIHAVGGISFHSVNMFRVIFVCMCCALSVNMPLCRKRRTHCWRSHTDNVWYQCYFFPFFLVVVVTKASKLLDWLIIIISEHLVLMACRVNSFPKDASNNALIIDLIIFYFFFFPGHILHRHTGVGDVRYACGTDCCIKFGLREHDNFVRKFFPHFFFVSSSSQNIFPFDAVSHGIW